MTHQVYVPVVLMFQRQLCMRYIRVYTFYIYPFHEPGRT